MAYSYAYPRPAVTADAVIFTMRADDLAVLLIKRGGEPFKGTWAFPGGYVEQNESLEKAVARELEEETGLTGISFEQLGAFGDPGRDPRGHTVTVAFYTFVASEPLRTHAGDDASEVAWHSLKSLDLTGIVKRGSTPPPPKTSKRAKKPPELLKLAFDHAKILKLALDRVRERLLEPTRQSKFHLAPPHFTLNEIRRVYEVIFAQMIDPRTFRKVMLARDFIEPIAPKKSAKTPGKKGIHKERPRSKAGELYRFKHAPQRRTIDD